MLSTKSKVLYAAITDLGKLRALWQVTPDLREDESVKEELETIDGAKGSCTTALCIIAGANILLDMEGEERAKNAAILLETKRDMLPGALIEQLEKVAPRASRPLKQTEKAVVSTT